MTRAEHIAQIAELLAVRLADAPLDVMGNALVLNLAAVITGYGAQRERAQHEFIQLLEARVAQLVAAGADTVH